MQAVQAIRDCCARGDFAGAQAEADKHSLIFNRFAQEPAFLVSASQLLLPIDLSWSGHPCLTAASSAADSVGRVQQQQPFQSHLPR